LSRQQLHLPYCAVTGEAGPALGEYLSYARCGLVTLNLMVSGGGDVDNHDGDHDDDEVIIVMVMMVTVMHKELRARHCQRDGPSSWTCAAYA
jgi:hypothetical protein